MQGERLRITGQVQGVGFRPLVWRLAQALGLSGEVYNDASGVVIELWGSPSLRRSFVSQLYDEIPPLARIDNIERSELESSELESSELESSGLKNSESISEFRITDSHGGEVLTGVAPDAAICTACAEETFDPANRRYRYPFTNCTHCGPRLSIVSAIPYDRANTSMRGFMLCDHCRSEYENPADRRFHAQPVACPVCGPRVWLEEKGVELVSTSEQDAISVAASALRQGAILAIKGLGGFQLACDAGNPDAIARLRSRKHRPSKPFALMASDLKEVETYCKVSEREAELLSSVEAPVVILESRNLLPGLLAPGLSTLGFMLPYTPLHLLLMAELERPLVMTSGNPRGAPQSISNQDARDKLNNLADLWLMHNRDILNRVDDSVARLMLEQPRLLRRARGYAPATMKLPSGFNVAPDTLAFGGELKNTICVLKNGAAIVSQFIGDLEQVPAFEAFQKTIDDYLTLYNISPRVLAADMHPEYLSAKYASERAAEFGLSLTQVQHHHAHQAACMAENQLPLNHPPVLSLVLDGLGWGDDDSIWGGEFLLADYRGYQRLGALKPVNLPGGTQAIRNPWRNCFAQLDAALGWQNCLQQFASLELIEYLQQKPLATLQRMVERGINSPKTSSCGRLFDAVAAALGVCRDEISYEGQAAIELEALCSRSEGLNDTEAGYPFDGIYKNGFLQLDSAPMWLALLDDLQRGEEISQIAERFHQGLAVALVDVLNQLWSSDLPRVVVLSGGVFQNKVLFEKVSRMAVAQGFQVLSHCRLPANDAGLSLGQAVVAAAKALEPV